ncbi:MAG: A24 family peptidase [Deltaproteobacteria bacterium]|nr:A24 family peptidase [Deltaproteobacteria bacterium]
MNSWFFFIFIFCIGAMVGSFLNVCIYRLPQGLSIAVPRSFCPACQTPIRAYDNIPIISFLLLGRKCRKCRAPILWRYPLVEALTGGLALAFFLKMGLTLSFFCYFCFAAALVVITFIDLDHRIIPDVISLPGVVIGFLLSLLGITLGMWSSLIGIAVGGGSLYLVAIVYEAVTKREGMGGGDVKLLAMIGAWLGWKAVLFTLFFASLTGSVIGGAIMMARKEDSKLAVPFGPFLTFSALAYVFFGEKLIHWYLNWGGF